MATKLTEEQIKDLKWVEENLGWIPYEGSEDDRYLDIPLPSGGSWAIPEEKLTEEVENALARGEADDIESIDLIISHLKKYDEEIGF
tara:strand:- start:73 stop:333 length:261 start_codon:yes stop_codon:yes gene_type:complete